MLRNLSATEWWSSRNLFRWIWWSCRNLYSVVRSDILASRYHVPFPSDLRQGVLFTRFIETKGRRGLHPLLLKEYLTTEEGIGGPQERVRRHARVGLSAIAMREKRSGAAVTRDGVKIVRGATRYHSSQVVKCCWMHRRAAAGHTPIVRSHRRPRGDPQAIGDRPFWWRWKATESAMR